MVDIHSHILPSIDDGSKNIDMTLEMLRAAINSGTKKIIATPHYCKGFAEVPYGEVCEIVEKLNKLMYHEKMNIEIFSGQEVYFSKDIVHLYKENIIGTINHSKYMLVELPMREFSKSTIDIFYELKLLGVNIILAHPERYHPIIKNPTVLNQFIQEGFLFQLNSGSIEGVFGKDVKRTAEILLNNKIYSFIGSDAHNLTSRNIELNEARRILKEIDEDSIKNFSENGNKILNNELVEFNGEIIVERKSFFDFIRRR